MHAALILAHGEFPPWHPVLVNFTAGLVSTSLVFELLGAVLKKEELRATGWWMLLAGAIVTPATALVGWLWFWSIQPADNWQMPIHQWLGTALAGVLIGLAVWRGLLRREGGLRAKGVPPGRPAGIAYLGALALFVVALFVQGELGGSMVHGRGVMLGSGAAPHAPTTPQAPTPTLDEHAGEDHHDHDHGENGR